MGAPKTQPMMGEDPTRVDARHYKTEAENDRARVLRIRYGPREKSVMHGHPDSIAIFLTDFHVRFTYKDGGTEEIRGKAGQVQLTSAFEHLPENLTGQPLELILVELKG